MHFEGLIIGVATFLIIGIFHPIVIKAYWYYQTRCWWVFLLLGLVCLVASVCISSTLLSTVLGVIAFSSFWTIRELFEQKQRIAKGWFKENPKFLKKD